MANDVLIEGLSAVIARVVAAASGPVAARLRKWQNSLKLTEVARQVRQVTKVKTLWKRDKAVSLYDFYYPSLVTFPGDGVTKEITKLSDLSAIGTFVIEGTAGQGKSIFLRYLYGQSLKSLAKDSRLPLFIELRRLSERVRLTDLINSTAKSIGLEMDDEIFDLYARAGSVVLLLDGFDEISQELVNAALGAIDDLCRKYPQVQVLITSRPDSGIQTLPSFDVLKLAHLEREDLLPFLSKICDDPKEAKAIVKAIDNAGTSPGIGALLRTPLLVTLLALIFVAETEVPDSIAKFYEELFYVLYYKHDKLKPAFRREHHIPLGYSDVRKLFAALCFRTRSLDKLSLSRETFDACMAWASAKVGIPVDARGMENELCKVACMLQEDGRDLSFIHKSVAEYHAARFICDQTDPIAKVFYESCGPTSGFLKWAVELKFLSELDATRYSQYLVLPELSPLLDQIGNPEDLSEGSFRSIPLIANTLRGIKVSLPPDITGDSGDTPDRVHVAGYVVPADFGLYMWTRALFFAIRDTDMLAGTEMRAKIANSYRTLGHGEVRRNPRGVGQVSLELVLKQDGGPTLLLEALRRAVATLRRDYDQALEIVQRSEALARDLLA